jgi:hypothetical protein
MNGFSPYKVSSLTLRFSYVIPLKNEWNIYVVGFHLWSPNDSQVLGWRYKLRFAYYLSPYNFMWWMISTYYIGFNLWLMLLFLHSMVMALSWSTHSQWLLLSIIIVYDHYPICNDQRFGFLKHLSRTRFPSSRIKSCLDHLEYSTSIMLSRMRLLWLPQ